MRRSSPPQANRTQRSTTTATSSFTRLAADAAAAPGRWTQRCHKVQYVRDVLKPTTGLPLISADDIAASLWSDAQAAQAYEAAQIAEARRRERIADRESFISATVFSHPSKVQLVSRAVDAGYLVHLHVVLVPVELTVQRVLERVRRGGHEVPEQKIRDRYARLWVHLDAAIRITDVTAVLDNSSARAPFRPCASFEYGVLIGSPSWPKWTPRALREAEGGVDDGQRNGE